MTMPDLYASPVRIDAPAAGSGSVSATRGGSTPVVVYGNRWCGLTQMVVRALARAGVDYEYVDLDDHPAIERRLWSAAGGRLRTPVVYVDGQWLVAPSIARLRSALTRTGVAA